MNSTLVTISSIAVTCLLLYCLRWGLNKGVKMSEQNFEYYLIKNQNQLKRLEAQYLQSNRDVKKRIAKELDRLRKRNIEIEKIMENK